jgi:hypothetical protein
VAVDQVLRYVRDAYASDPTGFDINQWARSSAYGIAVSGT